MSSCHLTYFAGRGRAEVIRLLLVDAGVSFTETFLRTRDDFLQICSSGKAPYLQVPLLEIDGHALVQTKAILRYVARTHGSMCVFLMAQVLMRCRLLLRRSVSRLSN